MSKQVACKITCVSRSVYYYKPIKKIEDEAIMHLLKQLAQSHLKCPLLWSYSMHTFFLVLISAIKCVHRIAPAEETFMPLILSIFFRTPVHLHGDKLQRESILVTAQK